MKKKLAKAATLIMTMTLINKVIGFIRDALVASSFGTTYMTDAYNVAMTILDLIFIMIAFAITTTFIPILSDTLNKKGKEEMFKFANNLMNIFTIIGVILVLLGVIFTPLIVKITANRLDGNTFNLAVQLTRVSVLSLVFLIIYAGHTAILQTLDDFLGPTAAGLVYNIPIIIYILVGAKGGIYGLMIATVLGAVIRTIVQIPFLYKHGFKFKLIFNIRDSRIKRMVLLVIPVLIGASANQINKLVDKTLASGLPEGSISALTYGERISDVIFATFAVAIITVVFPTLSRSISEKNNEKFKFYIEKAINNMNLILLPCTVGLILLSKPIITIIFKHGVFDNRGVAMTTGALVFYSLGIPFCGLREVFNKSLYALQDTKTSTINGIIAVIINIILNLLFINKLGLKGLALSTSISALSASVLLFLSLKRKIGVINGNALLKTTIKIIISTFIMGLIVYYSYQVTYHVNILIAVFISIILGILVYITCLRILKVEEFNDIVLTIKEKLKRV